MSGRLGVVGWDWIVGEQASGFGVWMLQPERYRKLKAAD